MLGEEKSDEKKLSSEKCHETDDLAKERLISPPHLPKSNDHRAVSYVGASKIGGASNNGDTSNGGGGGASHSGDKICKVGSTVDSALELVARFGGASGSPQQRSVVARARMPVLKVRNLDAKHVFDQLPPSLPKSARPIKGYNLYNIKYI